MKKIWKKLLSTTRLNYDKNEDEDARSPFQKDIDRIVFSSAFRRLAHKTQVHPLAEDDHIHTRLTHSIETGSVGRSLGTIIGNHLGKKHLLPSDFTRDDVGHVVQAACLAHDIGNPPFGHAGEGAIGHWFQKQFEDGILRRWDLDRTEKTDLEQFEGNAQGFRILTQLENNKRNGGLQLTHSTLGTFAKYPCTSHPKSKNGRNYVGGKKFSFFKNEKKYFKTIANDLGLIERGSKKKAWARHPLAFLVEAADDICYNIVDVEDAYILRTLNFKETKKLLLPLVNESPPDVNDWEIVAWLRAHAIGAATQQIASTFIKHSDDILSGKFETDLITASKVSQHFSAIKKASKNNIYKQHRKTELEIAGHQVINGILMVFVEAISDLRDNAWDQEKSNPRTQSLIRYMDRNFDHVTSDYEGLLVMGDYIAGMTDRFALRTYQKLHGHAL